MSKMNIRRGDVFLVDFGPIWSGQHGRRPAIIIQNNVGNENSMTTIVVPGTTKQKRMDMPTHVNIGRVGLGRMDSVACCENVQTIGTGQIVRYIDTLDRVDMENVDRGLMVSIGLSRKWRDA